MICVLIEESAPIRTGYLTINANLSLNSLSYTVLCLLFVFIHIFVNFVKPSPSPPKKIKIGHVDYFFSPSSEDERKRLIANKSQVVIFLRAA